MMRTVCLENNCAGCKLCFDSCPVSAISIDEKIKAYNAIIDDSKCINCNLCYKFCPQKNTLDLLVPLEWHQGWSKNPKVRTGSSSGGIAAEISRSFIKHGGEVLTCRFKGGDFVFTFFNKTKNLSAAAGSKYVKSDPAGIYKPLSQKLKAGKKILMIALPCQIAAAKAYVNNHENLYTVDLICHGTPSPKVLEVYLKGRNVNIYSMKDIHFRQKGRFGLNNGDKPIDKFGIDAYTYTFLNSLTYTENCYECKYARLERISDMTLGDSWDSGLSKEEQEKGISLILCQTEKGRELLKMSEVELKNVDIDKAVRANRQLNSPSQKHKRREYFIDSFEKGKEFEKIMLGIDLKFAVRKLVKVAMSGKFQRVWGNTWL